jgi:hypothetical protein
VGASNACPDPPGVYQARITFTFPTTSSKHLSVEANLEDGDACGDFARVVIGPFGQVVLEQ